MAARDLAGSARPRSHALPNQHLVYADAGNGITTSTTA
jgi:hypothetical protein